MNKKHYTLLLAIGGWLVSNVHRAWNNAPVDERCLFLYNDFKQDTQWYIYDTGNMLFILFVCIIALLWVPAKLKPICWALVLCQLFDLINYWLWHKQNEIVLTLQGAIFLILTIVTFKRWTDRSNYGNS